MTRPEEKLAYGSFCLCVHTRMVLGRCNVGISSAQASYTFPASHAFSYLPRLTAYRVRMHDTWDRVASNIRLCFYCGSFTLLSEWYYLVGPDYMKE